MAADELAVVVVHASAPHRVDCVELKLPAGTTVAQAIAASGLVATLDEAARARLAAGIWGRLVPQETVLREGDRVELTRPLTVDPKEARRLRYQRDRDSPPQRRRAARG